MKERVEAPSETEKEIMPGIRAGYVGAAATQSVSYSPTVGRVRKRERANKFVHDRVERQRERRRKLWMIVITRTD
jgi:hypothetical protein